MKRRRLGRGGPPVSAVGLGCMGMVFPKGSPERARSLAALDAALEFGIDLFDTADGYGGGASEETLADFITSRRERLFIATKFGNLRNSGNDRKVDGRPAYVKQACEASLRRLGIQTIDLYYLHRVDPQVPIEESVGAMKRLVEEGKVRYLGLSEAAESTLRRACAVHRITALQSEYSLWSRDAEAGMLDACRELDVGFVAYSPLGRGLLTGTIHAGRELPAGDRRRQNPRFFTHNLARNVEAAGPLIDMARRLAVTPTQVALAWLLAKGDAIVPIPGTTRAEHIRTNAAAVDLLLTADDVAVLDHAFPPGAAAGERNSPDAMGYMSG